MNATRILDLSESVTGAYATRLLAGTGVEVHIGEPEGGSPLRTTPPLVETPDGLRSTSWEYLAAYKDSVVIDPATITDDVNTQSSSTLNRSTTTDLGDLIDGYDAVVLATDGGPGAAFGPVDLLASELREKQPHLVVAAITPFGLTGPYSSWRAGPLELWAAGGHLTLNGEPDRQPIPGGGPWDSHLVGATAAVAIQAALIDAGETSTGALIDVGAMEVLASTHQWSLSLYTHTGAIKQRTGNRHGEMHHPLALYECNDGWACIAAATFQQWEGLCIAMDKVELLADDGLAGAADRFDRADEVDQLVTSWTLTKSVAEVVRACQDHFCPAGPVNQLSDIVEDEQLAFRDYWSPAPHLGPGAKMPSVPFQLPSTPPFRPAPQIGTAAPAPPTSRRRPGGDKPADQQPGQQSGGSPYAPLAGVRVLELTISWAGPLAARFLADLGADVIKIEHPTSRGVTVAAPDPDAEPEPWQWGELPPPSVRNGMYPDADPGTQWWNRMSLFNKMNRSKRSLCLDIKAPGGLEVFEQLVASADIVINNYSPRGVRSLGIDHHTLRSIKPDLVTVSMSGYGATGPGSEAVSWGPILDAASGLAATTGYADSGPYKQGLAYPDPVGGTHGAAAALAAWREHQETGEAVHVDLSQLETLLAIAGDQIIETTSTGRSPTRRGARSASYAPAGVYPCLGTDRWLALTVYSDGDWDRLAALIPELDQARWAELANRHADHDEIDRLITAWTAARDPHDAMANLQEAGVAAAAASTNQDLVEDPQLRSRGFMVTIDQPECGPRLYPGSAFLVDGNPLSIRPAPTLGADNTSVLEQLGVDLAQQEALTQTGTIASFPPGQTI
ncbi:MAG: CoA transferase [Acidimicrobiales bacterium]